MTFTEEEKALARNLCKSADTMKLLAKVFTPEEDSIDGTLEQNIVALSDEDYGRLMKVKYLANEKMQQSLARLKRLGSGGEGKSVPIAPK